MKAAETRRNRGKKGHRALEVRAISITSFARGGEGVGHVDHEGERRAVFVARTVPGDEVSARIDFSARPARGDLVELVRSGTGRVVPTCSHAAICGGCNWMHVDAKEQVRELERVIREATGRDDVVVESPVPARGARCRARVAVMARGGRATVGFREERTRSLVVVKSCEILARPLDEAFQRLPTLFASSTGDGEIRMALGREKAPRRVVLHVAFRGELSPSLFGQLEAGISNGWLQGVEISMEGARTPLRIGDPTPEITGGDGLPLELAPGGFSQASLEGNVALSRRVERRARELLLRPAAPDGCGAKILELYAGAGTLSIVLAPQARELQAVESYAPSTDALRRNLDARGMKATITTADAGAFVAARKRGGRIDLLVLDPPRTGAHDVVVHAKALAPRAILYVSCDPSTLARDLRPLHEARYAIRSVDALRLFPETSHVETIVALEAP